MKPTLENCVARNSCEPLREKQNGGGGGVTLRMINAKHKCLEKQ